MSHALAARDPGFRTRVRELDWLMLAVTVLCCLGLVMAVSVQSVQDGGDPLQAMKAQGAKLVAGVVFFVVCAAVRMEWLEKAAPWLFGVATAMVFAAALFGPEWNGARRWIPIAGRSFQPVDFARLALIVVTALRIAQAGERLGELRGGLIRVMFPALLLTAGLFLQPDNGNALLSIVVCTLMACAGGVALRWLIAAACIAIPSAFLIITQHDYVRTRIERFVNEDPPYQVRQSLIAIENGGAFGQGVGDGWRKLGYVPEPHNDFVFAIVGEELGFVGAASVVLLYLLLGFVGWRLVSRIQDPFRRYVVFGCSIAICIQAAANLMVTTGLAPAKGIDLPFVSAGGTNLVASLGAVGLIGNAARSGLRDDS
ncbi:MAG: FtsW/RodA/SpoVE family cell cycle protein [Planctomycetota bacterium]|jgi:cell division protein FtsW